MFRHITSVTIGAALSWGSLVSASGAGGSVASASAANVSIIKFIHNI